MKSKDQQLLEEAYQLVKESYYNSFPLKSGKEKFYRVLDEKAKEELLKFTPIIRVINDFDNRGSTIIVKEHRPLNHLDKRIHELQNSFQIKEIDWPTNVVGFEAIYRITNKGKEEYEMPSSFLEQIGSLDGIQLNLDSDGKGALALLSDDMGGNPSDNWPEWGHALLNDGTFKLIGAIKSNKKRKVF